MPDEIDDDVPVYFSPGDDNVDLGEEVDKKALLEDEPPIEWSRYKPEKTLEEAAYEAEKKGEVKILGKSNKKLKRHESNPGASDKRSSNEANGDSHKGGKSKKSGEDSSILQTATGKLRDMRAKLGIANRKEVDLTQFTSGTSDNEIQRNQESRSSSNITDFPFMKLLIGLSAINIFAVGLWCGSFIFPKTKMETSLVKDSQLTSKKVGKLVGDTTFSSIVERVSPVVVNIDTRFKRRSQRKQMRIDYGGANQDQASGVIITSTGHILTNNHVIPKNTQIRVTLHDGREFSAKVVGRDSYTDLAVIKIDTVNLPVAKFGQIHKMHSGDWAIVIGSPYGLDHSVTIGVISALDRTVADFNHHVPFIQTDAAINPGNSGGPLVNIDGEIIGIATGAVRSGARGIAFAIPIDIANRVSKRLIKDGMIARPYFGVYMQDVDPGRKKARTLPSNPIFVMIRNVVPNGPADQSGLRRGDIIRKVNGTPVNSSDEVRAFIKISSPGDVLDFTVQRGKSVVDKKVKLGIYPKDL